MSTASFINFFNQQIQQSLVNSRLSLLVQIKIKNKGSKNINIANVYNSSSIDQQIRWFIQTNNLKEAAFQYIKSIISKKISTEIQIRDRSSKKISEINSKKAEKNIQVSLDKIKEKSSISLNSFQPNKSQYMSPQNMKNNSRNIRIKIQSKIQNSQTTFTKQPQQNLQSFVFNSSFTLPSSIGDKERSFLTDKLFQHAFDTIGKHSEDFSNISEANQIQAIQINSQRPPLSVCNHQQFKLQDNIFHKNIQGYQNAKSFTPQKPPIKITLSKKNRQNIISAATPTSTNRKKIISTRQRKQAIITSKRLEDKYHKYAIYNADNLESLVSQYHKQLQSNNENLQVNIVEQDFPLSCIPQYLEQDLKKLFVKLTLNNPLGVQQLHSQYVSYQKLSRQQLLFMGALFQKIDHKDLNNLNFCSFKRNSIKYCWKQLEAMHNIKFKNQTVVQTQSPSSQFKFN